MPPNHSRCDRVSRTDLLSEAFDVVSSYARGLESGFQLLLIRQLTADLSVDASVHLIHKDRILENLGNSHLCAPLATMDDPYPSSREPDFAAGAGARRQ